MKWIDEEEWEHFKEWEKEQTDKVLEETIIDKLRPYQYMYIALSTRIEKVLEEEKAKIYNGATQD